MRWKSNYFKDLLSSAVVCCHVRCTWCSVSWEVKLATYLANADMNLVDTVGDSTQQGFRRLSLTHTLSCRAVLVWRQSMTCIELNINRTTEEQNFNYKNKEMKTNEMKCIKSKHLSGWSQGVVKAKSTKSAGCFNLIPLINLLKQY